MANIFEKTMQACRESRKKDLKEAKKNASKKAITEKINKKRIKKEADEDDLGDEFVDDVADAVADDIVDDVADDIVDGEDDETMMDIQDDIVAVVDPDLDAEELDDIAMSFQQIVDDTPENEIPETDEYLDQNIYGCPVCGQKFFSLDDMSDGGTCPLCGETADGFVLVGEVDSSEDAGANDTEDAEDEIADEVADDIADDVEDSDDELVVDDEEFEESKKPMRRPVARRSNLPTNLDEKTFNVHLGRFVRENYSNIASFRVVGARMKGNKLTLECNIRFKSGKSKKARLECKYNRASNFMKARDNGVFKNESKTNAPFVFKISTKNNTIACEGLRYNFTTRVKVKNESKRAQVYGSTVAPLKESKKVARKPMARKSESVSAVARRNARRRITRR